MIPRKKLRKTSGSTPTKLEADETSACTQAEACVPTSVNGDQSNVEPADDADELGSIDSDGGIAFGSPAEDEDEDDYDRLTRVSASL